MKNLKTIFIVDDNATNLTAAEEALADKYRVISLASAAQMFNALKKFTPDLILLDIEMPEMNGFETIAELIKTHPNIPVIFLTGRSDPESEALGIKMGAVDFIMKPFSQSVLRIRIKNHLNMDEIIRERTAELKRLQNSIVHAMADLVESRDECTGGHIDRTAARLDVLITAMLDRGVYADEIREWDMDTIIYSARLHDVGKITISDAILNKPGKLTHEEFEAMKEHALAGGQIIDKMMERTGSAKFLQSAKLFAVFHHERWDGSGYPNGLKGLSIPLHGRILSIIDVYDALVSDRAYKKAFSHAKAREIILEGMGTHFDPDIVKVFDEVHELFV